MDPTPTFGLGAALAKYGVAIAGFGGSVASLAFLKGLTARQGFASVLTGLGCAIYWAKPVTWWLTQNYQVPDEDYFRDGVAFTIGLFAMAIIPGIKSLLSHFISRQGGES